MAGLTYFNFKGFPDDISTSGEGLTRKQIDLNFFNLKKSDIKDSYWDSTARRIVIETLGGAKFYVENIDPYKFIYDEEERKISATTVDGKQVAFISKVTTDESLDGDGTIADPIRLNFSSKSGYYKPVLRVVDTIPTDDSTEGARYVLKQNENASGRLYTAEEIKFIDEYLKTTKSPWRVATKEDWDAMLNAVDPCVLMEGTEYVMHTELGYCGHNAGNILKDDLLWGGSDSYDFSAVPVKNLSAVYGMYDKNGAFYEKHILDDTNQILTVQGTTNGLYSIRFIKNNDYQIYENILNDDYSCIKMPYIEGETTGYTIWTKNNVYTTEVNGIEVGTDIVNGINVNRYYLIQYDAFDAKWMMHPMDVGEHFFAIEEEMEYRVMFDIAKGGYYLGSVADLIQSSMVQSDYNHETHQLILVFDTNVGHQTIAIDLGELIDIYNGDNVTIMKRGNTFSAIVDVPGGVLSYNTFAKFSGDVLTVIDNTQKALKQEIEETAQELQDKIDDLDDKVDSNYNTLTQTIGEETTKLNTKIDNLETEIRGDVQTKIGELQDTINNDINAKIDNLKKTDEQLAEQIRILDSGASEVIAVDLVQFREGLDAVNARVDQNEEDIADIKSELSAFQGTVNESLEDLESKVTSDVSNQIEALSGELGSFKEEVTEALDDLDERVRGDVSNQIETISGTVSDHIEEMSDFKENLETQISGMVQEVRDKDYIIALALNDLNRKFLNLYLSKLDKDAHEAYVAEMEGVIEEIYSAFTANDETLASNIEEVENNLTESASALNGAIEENMAQIDALSGAMVDYMETTDNAIESLENNVTGPVSEQISQLEDKVNQQKDDILGIIDDNELTVSAALNDLDERIIAVSGVVENEINVVMSGVQAQIAELEEKDNILSEHIDELGENNTQEIETKLAEQTQLLNGLDERIGNNEERIDELEGQVEFLGDDIANMSSEISSAMTELESACTEYTDTRIAEVQTELDENYYTKREIGGNYSENHTVAQTITDTQKVSAYSMNQLQYKIKLLTEQLAELQTEFDALKNQNS